MDVLRIPILVCFAFLSLSIGQTVAQEKNCAVVVMHGKWGNPQYIGFFGRKLEPTCDYKSIELPWSRRRSYDEPYPVALAEIKEQVSAFRAKGYKRVLLAGHSFGSNAALAYMAEVGDVDGIIALAPGHVPELMYERGIGKNEVDHARELVAAGKGDETLRMDDLNQGKRESIRMSAKVLLSYFDPAGLGNMPATTARFKKPVPFLWVVGTQDVMYQRGAGYAFNSAPPHPSSKYLVVEADHSGTPDVATKDILEWIKGLP
jgi:pimeloyl-ACP methyl ester carboxylesterase